MFSVLTAQTYEDMVTRSLDYVEQEDYAAAEQALKAALRKEPANPNNTMLLVNLGTIQRNLGKLDEALISYNVAIEKFPDNSFVRHNRAALFCEMNKFGDALMDYNTILLKDDKDLEALYRRGLIQLSNKNLFAAEEDFEKIVEIFPENLYGKMGLASVMKRRGEWKDAEDFYSDLISKHKTSGELYYNRAECYLQLNRLARAQEDIAKALSLGYDNASVYILRGQLRLAQYDKQLAKEDFLRAKEMGADESALEIYLSICK
jgi:Tfp pilus assembly protein PilF